MLKNLKHKQIPDHPEYLINNLGEIYSTYVNRYVRATVRKDGGLPYMYVGLINKNKEGPKYKYYYVHQLVMWAHKGKPLPGQQVDHIDRNPTNNCLTNLRYVYPVGNCENRNTSKLTTSKNLDIKIILELRKFGLTNKEIARKYNCTPRSVSRVISQHKKET